MSRRFLLIVSALLYALLAAPVAAQAPGHPTASGTWGFFTGNHFQSMDQAQQLAYTAGVFDALRTVVQDAVYTDQPESDIGIPPAAMTVLRVFVATTSIPDTVTLGQLHSVATKYLGDNPQSTHNSAALLIWRALAEADWE